jgi:hypothetical protein
MHSLEALLRPWETISAQRACRLLNFVAIAG